jgi:hypothetical protein
VREGWTGDLEICAWSYGSPANGAWLPGVVDRLQVLPALEAGEQQVLEAIVEGHERASIAALIPGEADVPLVARLADRLADRGIRTLRRRCICWRRSHGPTSPDSCTNGGSPRR